MSADSLEMLFREFRLPTMAARVGEMLESAEHQNWGYRKLLVQLCEAEASDRRERKRERLLRDSQLPNGKTLGNLKETQLPAKVRRQLPTLLEGGFVERAENILAFGLPGRGKSHFLSALGRELDLRPNRQLFDLTVITRDRTRLFADVAGVLAAWGMNIVRAGAFSNEAGVIVDSFHFTDVFRTIELNPSEKDRFLANIHDVVAQKVSVQQLLEAKKALRLNDALKRLDRFDAIILDDLGYTQQSREEMEVLFTFLAERYECQRAGQQQSGVLEMGPDFQGSDDDDGGGGPVGASRDHFGIRR